MKKKSMNALVKEICKREGKKSNVKIGDVREILKILAEMQSEWLVKNKRPRYSPLAIIHFAAADDDV